MYVYVSLPERRRHTVVSSSLVSSLQFSMPSLLWLCILLADVAGETETPAVETKPDSTDKCVGVSGALHFPQPRGGAPRPLRRQTLHCHKRQIVCN